MDAVKKISLIAAAIGALAIQSSAMAAEGTLSFKGNITSAGCKINGNTTFTMAPDLGTIAASTFTGVGSRAQRNVPITLKLTDCPTAVTGVVNGSTVKVYFTTSGGGLATPANPSGGGSGVDPDNPNLLALTKGTGVASGVGVGIWNAADGTQLNLNSSAAGGIVFTYDQGQGTTINLAADYQQTKTSVVAGTADAVGYLAFDYK